MCGKGIESIPLVGLTLTAPFHGRNFDFCSMFESVGQGTSFAMQVPIL